MESSTKTGPRRRQHERLNIPCPTWLKRRLKEEANAQERPMSELVRERLAAPYKREAQK